LQKTPPRVLIFAEKKADVDHICEYLLVKGIEVASIHGGKGLVFLKLQLDLTTRFEHINLRDIFNLVKLRGNDALSLT